LGTCRPQSELEDRTTYSNAINGGRAVSVLCGVSSAAGCTWIALARAAAEPVREVSDDTFDNTVSMVRCSDFDSTLDATLFRRRAGLALDYCELPLGAGELRQPGGALTVVPGTLSFRHSHVSASCHSGYLGHT
jgi:hypothetical protein